MCIKVDNRIECDRCGYPLHEARYPDDYDHPLPCNATKDQIDDHLENVNILSSTQCFHPYDCKCLLCR